MLDSLPQVQYLALVPALYLGYRILGQRRRDAKFPTGPSGLPWIGNLWDIPPAFAQPGPFLYYRDLVSTFGSMIGFHIFGEKLLIVHDREDAEQLLEKASHVFSSRRRLIFGGKYQAHDKRLVMLQYGPQLRQQRAAFSEMLNPRSVSTYETLMEHETVKLLSEVLASPPPSAKQSSDSVRLQIKRYIASLVFTLTYGQKLADDENLHAVLEVLDTLLMDAAPGAHLVDTFPILDNLPDFLSPWRREANEKHHRESSLYLRLARSVRTDIQAGIAPDCFASQLWQQFDQGSLDEETLAYVAGSAFEASIHTTSGTLMWFVMAMRLHPVEQAKAQREIDQLLLEHSGSALEMPSLSMLTQLPYCVALIKEVLRWQPVAPGAFPHVATADYEYKGYVIPKDTLVIPNVYAIHHDPRLYTDPDTFNPDRFLTSQLDLSSNEVFTSGHSGFGFGRRICPARYLAGKTVFIAAIRMLWAFDFRPVIDDKGEAMPVHKFDCPWTVVNEPSNFPVQITPRSQEHAQKISTQWEATRTV